MREPALHVGTAGWSVPAQYADDFPAGGTHLERYARRLNAAEINSSFYRPHRHATYERWAASVGADFRFAVKLPKTITHQQRLVDYDALLARFLEEAGGLGGKLGVLLVQLPPSLRFDAGIVDAFFRDLRKRTKADIACEPRHATWFDGKADALLKKRRVARVAADPAPAQGAGEPGGWEGLVYWRMHGSPRMYYSDYDATALAALARRVASRRAKGARAWCIFDNTAAFFALGNALSFASRPA